MRTSHGGRRWLGRIVALALGASIVAGMLPAMRGYFDQWAAGSGQFLAKWLAVAFLVSMVVRPLSAFGWQMVLGAFGQRLPFRITGRIWMVAESCRWLPGGVWHFCSRAIQCNGYGVPLPVALASMAAELLLTVAAAFALALVAVTLYGGQEILADQWLSWRNVAIGSAVAVTIVLLGFAAYRPLRRQFPQQFEAVAARFAPLRQVHPRAAPTVGCFLFYLIIMALNGVAFYATAVAVSPDAALPWFAAVAANCVAWVAGLVAVAVMVPAGLGVREGVLVLQMSAWMRVTDALLVAVLWRVLLLAVELMWVAVAGVSLLVARVFLSIGTVNKQTNETMTCHELGD